MRVPKRYLGVAEHQKIHRSLDADSERMARELLPGVKARLLAALGEMPVIKERLGDAGAYRDAQKIAQARGFSCRPLSELPDTPLADVFEREEASSAELRLRRKRFSGQRASLRRGKPV